MMLCLAVVLTTVLLPPPAAAAIDADCQSAAESIGVDFAIFASSVAHGIHALTVEDVRYFFDPAFPVGNSLPTANTNLSDTDHPVLLAAPSFPSVFTFPSGHLLDYLLTNNDNPDTFYIQGLTSLEKLAHGVHMHEVWQSARDRVMELRRVRKVVKRRGAVCPCLVAEADNGILDELSKAFTALAAFSSPSGSSRATFSRNYEVNLKYTQAKAAAPRPPLTSSSSWVAWRAMLEESSPTEAELFNLAVYLYCKLY